MNQAQLDGITKARLAACIADNQATYATDADYLARVCADAGLAELPAHAPDSYAQQWSGQTILELEAQLAAMLENEDRSAPGEILTNSPQDQARERWLQRTISQAGQRLGVDDRGLLQERGIADEQAQVNVERRGQPAPQGELPEADGAKLLAAGQEGLAVKGRVRVGRNG